MNQLLLEDVTRERYSAMLRECDEERRATEQLQVKRAWRRVERARARLERALEEAYALPAQPNPVVKNELKSSVFAADREYDKQLVA